MASVFEWGNKFGHPGRCEPFTLKMWPPVLFDGDALGQVSGLVHIAASQHGHMVGQQL